MSENERLVTPGEVVWGYIQNLVKDKVNLQYSDDHPADFIGIDYEQMDNLICGYYPITPAIAEKLTKLGRPAHFWINLERQYQADRARLSGIDPKPIKQLLDGLDIEQESWESDKDILTVNGKPCGGTFSGRDSLHINRWWESLKQEIADYLNSHLFSIDPWIPVAEQEPPKDGKEFLWRMLGSYSVPLFHKLDKNSSKWVDMYGNELIPPFEKGEWMPIPGGEK